jgi:hypothetical protein
MLEFKEDTTLILSEAEAHLASGQTAIHSKANQTEFDFEMAGYRLGRVRHRSARGVAWGRSRTAVGVAA